jgi:hypothetical protein
MGRSGYTDDNDFDNWNMIRWRGAVTSALRGKRGQAFLQEMLDELDAMPEKRLIAAELQEGAAVCAIGSVGVRRGVDLSKLDPEDYDAIAQCFGIPPTLVREIEFVNDDDFAYWSSPETPEQRFARVRRWVVQQLENPGSA